MRKISGQIHFYLDPWRNYVFHFQRPTNDGIKYDRDVEDMNMKRIYEVKGNIKI